MDQKKIFRQGLLTGMLVILTADAIRWFIASWNPDVSITQTILVAVQIVVCIGGVIWLIARHYK